jgi:phosphopantothenoylcysteine decarboxylase/phosphopantothenate--cysteine ligase
MHPAKELIGLKSNKLQGKKIVLGITGSIAAVETIKLIHDLIRHGADVYPVLTKAASKIIDPEAVRYASSNKPITQLTGEVEHVALCGLVKDRADMLLIAPCTANTISKIANGIDDTTVTTFATTAIGSKIPIFIVPAMHSCMYEHPIIQENIWKLSNKNLNIEIINPILSENKYKLPSHNEIISRVIKKLWKGDLLKKRVLIIAGATVEKIDDMRVLTNQSTGATGIALAMQAFLRGADVELWLGAATLQPTEFIKYERFQNVGDLKSKVMCLNDNLRNGKKVGKSGVNNKNFDIIIVCAAISDYTPSSKIQGKLPSGKKSIELKLVPTEKIIKIIRKKTPNSFLMGFKAESGLSEKELIEKATQRLKDWQLNMIGGNDLANVTEKSNHIIIIQSDKKPIHVKGDKNIIGERIFNEIVKHLKPSTP